MICNSVQTYVGDSVCVTHLNPNTFYEYQAQIWGGRGGCPCSVSLSQGVLGLKKVEDPCFSVQLRIQLSLHSNSFWSHNYTHTPYLDPFLSSQCYSPSFISLHLPCVTCRL